MALRPFWVALGPLWCHFGWLWVDLGPFWGSVGWLWGRLGPLPPPSPSHPTAGALHAGSLHPGHRRGGAGPHLHRPPFPPGHRGDQQVGKKPHRFGILSFLTLFSLVFPHFLPYFPVFSPFSSSGTSDRFTRILQHILTQRRYQQQPQNGAFLGQNQGISAPPPCFPPQSGRFTPPGGTFLMFGVLGAFLTLQKPNPKGFGAGGAQHFSIMGFVTLQVQNSQVSVPF